MSLIARSAYFKVCPDCGEHGRIFLSDGRRTSSILSKEAGMICVGNLLDAKQISEEEASALKQQIGDAKDLREEASILDAILGVAGGVVLYGKDAEDDESSKHGDFYFGHIDPNQRGQQTMH